ncbi:MAG: DUF4079 domain-containing protein [Cyanobacteria bacterium P01_A01_bin.83]
MDLPSFIWLWKIAAWAMGGTIAFYLLLLVSGSLMFYGRVARVGRPPWLRDAHYAGGIVVVFLVLLLLAIGIVGTVGYYGTLGHSPHLWAGLFVVGLIALSAWSAHQIDVHNHWARSLHIWVNAILFVGLAYVSWTGWSVVQKYL